MYRLPRITVLIFGCKCLVYVTADVETKVSSIPKLRVMQGFVSTLYATDFLEPISRLLTVSIRYKYRMVRLSDEQWERIRSHFPEEHFANGRPGFRTLL